MITQAKKAKGRRSATKPRQRRFGQTDKRVHRDLYAAIIDHSLSPGTALQEDALATAFGVSRTVIRKVLQQLALERLVDIVPNRGAAVAKPTAEEAREVFEARRVVERILVEKAMAHASDADIAELIATARSEQVAFETGNRQERVKLSGDFHRKLAKLGGNQVLGDFLNELVSRTSLIIALYESPGAVPCSHSEHLEIADAMKRRDVAKAVQYMEHHLLHIEAQTDLTDVHQKVDFKSLFGAAE